MSFAKLSLKGRALRYLAQREHTRAELERKLARFADDTLEASAQTQISAALDELAAQDLLSDDRAAASVLLGQGQRQGSRRLRQRLQAKGLAPERVAASLQQARVTEQERAQQAWHRRFGEPPADAADRARQIRFLAGRGFEADTIRRVVPNIDDD